MSLTVELTPEQQVVFDLYLKDAETAGLNMDEFARTLISKFDSFGLRNRKSIESAETFELKAIHRQVWVIKEVLYSQYKVVRDLEQEAYRQRNASIARDKAVKLIAEAANK